ncbi:unnamed protein product [Nippostrongylus brasiliensis]|uniref:Uncharacterized protein n=1 Tax=Nippostrongylus brasiliensis TaxID=27835 RepID=A0A0N4XW43_NIPBR|nr:unnamed protein product [Nippostrongylus brasiliensis]
MSRDRCDQISVEHSIISHLRIAAKIMDKAEQRVDDNRLMMMMVMMMVVHFGGGGGDGDGLRRSGERRGSSLL